MILIGGDFRYALSVVDDLEKAMIESGEFVLVEVTKRPLDVESDNALSGNLGARGNGKGDQAVLEFKLIREVKKNG